MRQFKLRRYDPRMPLPAYGWLSYSAKMNCIASRKQGAHTPDVDFVFCLATRTRFSPEVVPSVPAECTHQATCDLGRQAFAKCGPARGQAAGHSLQGELSIREGFRLMKQRVHSLNRTRWAR